MKINIIAAMARNRAIGFRNRLLYHLPDDMKRFKALTTGHTIIMGRRTFDSLPNGALPQRRNIVISRSHRHIDGCEVYGSLNQALKSCGGEEEVFIIGGESIYRQALAVAHRIYLTLVDDTPTQFDTLFPEIDTRRWQETKKEKHEGFSFIQYDLKRSL
jgi:dihydrofolate reductase